MRIASGTTDQVAYFVALDSSTGDRKTGLTGFTVYRSRNGGASTAMTSPTVTEVDASNMPGTYKILLDEDMTIGAGNITEDMVFHVSASGMDDVSIGIELFDPAGGLNNFDPATDTVARVTLVDTTTTNTDMRGTNDAASATSLAIIDANVDEILIDTGDTLPAQITALDVPTVASILTTPMTESYAAAGDAPTLAQALFLIQQSLGDFSISGTTLTVKKIDGSSVAAAYTLNSNIAPTSTSRAS